jgi:multimeric flavodoxin WrbA
MQNYDVIVWATPVYYYEMSGQMKTLIDRANSLYSSNYKFKEVYVITASADGSKGVAQTVINGVNGWIACFNGVQLKGFIDGGNLEAPNEAKTNEKLLKDAYNLGKNI